MHGLDHGDDVSLHHALDLGQILEHRLGPVLGRRAVELRHQLVEGQHHHIGELAVREAQALDMIGGVGGTGGPRNSSMKR
jgi:hypothetical protein